METEEIRQRWDGVYWSYRERRGLSGKILCWGLDDQDGDPITSSPFVESAKIFQLLGSAPNDIAVLLAKIEELTHV